MKRFVVLSLVFVLSLFVFCGCKNDENKYLRIHIRANSNLEIDQSVKYKVKDKVVDYLVPLISDCDSFDSAIEVINQNNLSIKNICDDVLNKEGFTYEARVGICKEYFPTRAYGEYVLPSDFYDAVIIELGDAVGDNWWCVVYPPLCFVNAKELSSCNIKYKSKLVEIIDKFFG